jgi:hypothetical protein
MGNFSLFEERDRSVVTRAVSEGQVEESTSITKSFQWQV